jgi:prophage maintenance system killer protein
LAAAAILLEWNAHRLAADNDEVFDFTMNVARGEVRRKEITRWLEENSERLEAT